MFTHWWDTYGAFMYLTVHRNTTASCLSQTRDSLQLGVSSSLGHNHEPLQSERTCFRLLSHWSVYWGDRRDATYDSPYGKNEWGFCDIGPFLSQPAEHPPSFIAWPTCNLNWAEATVKHLSDVDVAQPSHSVLFAYSHSIRGPGCDTPDYVDWSDLYLIG